MSYVPPHLRNADVKKSNAASGGSASRNQNNRTISARTSQGRSNDFSSSRGGQSRWDRNINQGPPKIINYCEKRGIDPSKLAIAQDASAQPEGQAGGKSFATWDVRTIKKTLTSELGFSGSPSENEQEKEKLYANQVSTGINFDKYDNIPVETSGNDVPDPIDAFSKSNLHPTVKRNLHYAGFEKPTPVQKYSIPIGLNDRDLMACAQTGSGKTGGFLFPVISRMLQRGAFVPEIAQRGTCFPNALVMAPTRELALQIFEESKKFTFATGVRCVVVYGGADPRLQRRELSFGCDILVGTPGRIIDFYNRGSISLAAIQHLILDEADRMLDMGFEPSMRQIINEFNMPPLGERTTFMFSATFPKEIQRLASDFLSDYVFLAVGKIGAAAQDITQTIERVEEHKKRALLVDILSAVQSGLVIVFSETKRGTEALQNFLIDEGYPATSIHGDRTQMEREQALRYFKAGQAPILVATDVAARGLDIDNVNLVINYDLPNNIDDYVHRIGRTGRAGNKGAAYSFFSHKNEALAADLLKTLEENSQQIPDFLRSLGSSRGFGGGGYGRRPQQPTRDFRSGQGNSRSGNKFGSRQGGGGGGGRAFSRQGGGAPRGDAW